MRLFLMILTFYGHCCDIRILSFIKKMLLMNGAISTRVTNSIYSHVLN